MRSKVSSRYSTISDTSAEAERFQIEGYRRMSSAEKLHCVQQLNLAVQQMALIRLEEQYPKDTERQRRLRLASLWHPAELMREAFGWDPEVEGR